NDLLNILEEGKFEIPELVRSNEPSVEIRAYDEGLRWPVTSGKVECRQFPFIAMTSNGEREFPAPFLRRCIRITVPEPTEAELGTIVNSHLQEHLSAEDQSEVHVLIGEFFKQRKTEQLATDQLLNAIFVVFGDGRAGLGPDRAEILKLLLKQLTTPQAT
ncbi:MAG: MoxR family ATPase, partial [Bryobacteraceae bacterium]|nr:MoxR family ATPase [Bryobacteraceae bacterium]